MWKNRKRKLQFSPIGNGDEATNNTPETIKDDPQTKRTLFTERFAAMVEMKPREKEEVTAVTEKSKTFRTVSPITTETKKNKEQVKSHKKQRLAKINELWRRKHFLLSWET